jgi:hypothetical protein
MFGGILGSAAPPVVELYVDVEMVGGVVVPAIVEIPHHFAQDAPLAISSGLPDCDEGG